MRNPLLLFLALAVVAARAQSSVQVASFSFSSGIHPTLSFQFEGTDEKYVESWWKDELKRVSQDVTNKKEVVGAAVLLPQISTDTVRVLMKAEQRKGMPFVMAHVAILTRDGWVGPASNAQVFEGAKAYVQQQSTMLRRQLAQQELARGEKGLDKLNNELDNLRRDKERAEASIEKAKQRSAEAVLEQERLRKEQDELAMKVAEQRKDNADEASAEGEKLLADLLKQEARLQDKRRRAGEDELNQKKKAEELAWEVKQNAEAQVRKAAEVTRQEQLVKQLREKLEAIR